MSFGRGGGRGGRGGRGGGSGGAGRGALADLSLGTLSFADLLATSRADIGGVLYPKTGVEIPVTDLPSTQEAQTVDLEVDRWIHPTHPITRRRWLIDGVIKPNIGAKKSKTNQRPLSKPFIHQFSELDIQSKSTSSENWLYSDRYKSNQSTQLNQDDPNGNNPNQYKFLHLLEKSFFPPDLWTGFCEGKKKIIRKTTLKRSTGKVGLSGMVEDEDGQEAGDGEKDENKEEEVEVVEEEEIDEDDPDYDNNYFDNGDDDMGMDSGGDGGDEGGVF